MAVININSGGPEGKEREFGLTWSSDLPSVRKPYTRKAHIPEDDVVFGDGESAPSGDDSVDAYVTLTGVAISSKILNLHITYDSVVGLDDLHMDLSDVTDLAVYVPADLVDDYKADAAWSDYADVIFAEPETESEETVEETPGTP